MGICTKQGSADSFFSLEYICAFIKSDGLCNLQKKIFLILLMLFFSFFLLLLTQRIFSFFCSQLSHAERVSRVELNFGKIRKSKASKRLCVFCNASFISFHPDSCSSSTFVCWFKQELRLGFFSYLNLLLKHVVVKLQGLTFFSISLSPSFFAVLIFRSLHHIKGAHFFIIAFKKFFYGSVYVFFLHLLSVVFVLCHVIFALGFASFLADACKRHFLASNNFF